MTIKFRRTPTAPQSYVAIAAINFANNQENLIGFSILNQRGLPIAIISVDQNFYLSSGLALRGKIVTGLEVRGVNGSNLYFSPENSEEIEQIEELSYKSWNRINESLSTIKNCSSLFLTTCTLGGRDAINSCIFDDSKSQMKGMLIKNPESGTFALLYDQNQLSQISFFIGNKFSFGYGATNYRIGETPTDGDSSISISSTFHNSIPNGPNPGWLSSPISTNETAQILDSFSEKLIPIEIHSTRTDELDLTDTAEKSFTRPKTLTHPIQTYSPSFTKRGISRFTNELLSGSKTISQHTEEVSSTISKNSSPSNGIKTDTSSISPSTLPSRSFSNTKPILPPASANYRDETAIIAGKAVGITFLASAFLTGLILIVRKVRKVMAENSQEIAVEEDIQETSRGNEVSDDFFEMIPSQKEDTMAPHPHMPEDAPSATVNFPDYERLSTRNPRRSTHNCE